VDTVLDVYEESLATLKERDEELEGKKRKELVEHGGRRGAPKQVEKAIREFKVRVTRRRYWRNWRRKDQELTQTRNYFSASIAAAAAATKLPPLFLTSSVLIIPLLPMSLKCLLLFLVSPSLHSLSFPAPSSIPPFTTPSPSLPPPQPQIKSFDRRCEAAHGAVMLLHDLGMPFYTLMHAEKVKRKVKKSKEK
jgi:hypothetical protein